MREVAIGTLVAVLGALGVAFAGEIIGLIRGEPDPSGSVSVTQTQRDQTLRMFRGQALKPAGDETLGLTLDVRREGKDTPAGGCRLRWSYLDMDGPTPVTDAALVEQRARHVSPNPRSCTTQTRLWVPVTAGLEGYERVAIRVELFAGSHFLGSAMSETLTLG